MSLTFREQAIIAMMAGPASTQLSQLLTRRATVNPNLNPRGSYTGAETHAKAVHASHIQATNDAIAHATEAAISLAQTLADAVCEAYDHDWISEAPGHVNQCARCGTDVDRVRRTLPPLPPRRNA